MVQSPSEDDAGDSLEPHEPVCALVTANKMGFEVKDSLDVLIACLCWITSAV